MFQWKKEIRYYKEEVQLIYNITCNVTSITLKFPLDQVKLEHSDSDRRRDRRQIRM